MKIDYLSDLHLNYYFNHREPIEPKQVKDLFNKIFLKNNITPGEVLVVAGDIGHFNIQNIEVLKIFKKEYYKHIVCVLGNHDYYLNNKDEQERHSKDSFQRVAEMRNLINAEENMYCLNGTVVEIEGIKFGGADSSYSNAYIKEYFPLADHPKANNEMWKRCMPDYKGMFGVNQYNLIYKLELPKIEAVYKECDVMVTHVHPSFLHRHMSPAFKNQQSNMFFSFDGHKFLREGTMKYWIFGHTHDGIE